MSNIGQAVLDVVGLAASIYTGNPLFFALSAAAGSLLFPSRLPIQGPMLADLRTTTVTIGAPLVIPYGTIAVPGNVIYLGLLQTTTQTEGKGGGGPTIYTYYQTVGVALCAGPIIGVQRIWENGKLVYDTRPQLLGESADTYSARLTANAAYALTFVLYLGTTTQGPDSTMEEDQGAGNVPGFRGLAYIVYPNRQLQDSQGLRHPQAWKFEVLSGGTVENSVIAPTYMSGALNDTIQDNNVALDAVHGRYYIFNADNNGNAAVLGFNVSDNTQFVQRTVASMAPGIATGLGSNYIRVAPDGGVLFTNYDAVDVLVWRRLDPLTLATLNSSDGEDALDFPTWYAFGSTTDLTGAAVSIIISNSSIEYAIMRMRSALVLGAPLDLDYSSFSYGGMRVVAAGNENNSIRYYAIGYGSSGIDLYKILWTPGTDPVLNPNPSVSSTRIGNVPISAFAPGATAFNQCAGLLYDPSGSVITSVNVTAGASPNGAYLLSIDTTAAGVLWTVEAASVFTDDADVDASVISGETLYVPAGQSLVQIDTTSGAATVISLSGQLGSASLDGTFTYNGPAGTMVSASDEGGYYVLLINKSVPGSPSLAEIITDLCGRVGYGPDKIDVSDLTAQTVWGYALGRQMTARDAITPLQQFGMFDVVLSDTVLRFQKRGKPIRRTLVADDLGAYQHGSEAAVEWQATRALDTDLPRFIRVHYLAPSRDYDNGEQVSPSRMTSSTVNDVSVELGIALEDNAAAQCAEIIWADLWGSRESWKATVDMSLGELEPGDPVYLPILGRTERVRIQGITNAGSALLTYDLVSDDVDAYTSNAVASTPEGGPNPISFTASSSLFLIDSPLLRDQDDTNRMSDPLYTAANASSGGTWNGANVYESPDGAAYAQVAQAPNAVNWGQATSALGDTDEPFVTDTVNTVTLQVAAGSTAPTGITTAALLNGGNPAIMLDPTGSLEVFQFRDVTVNEDETVTLSYLLRGRRGTDSMTGNHQINSSVLFPSTSNVELIDLPLTDLGVTLYWKAVASGASLASAGARAFAAIGRSLMPYAPWNPSAAVYSTGDIAINAIRRARIGAPEWVDRETDNLPLAEDSSLFQCDILIGGAVARTLQEVQLPIVYSASEVTSDFGSPPSELTIALYQMSQEVGRGFPTRATLPVTETAGTPPSVSPSWVAPGAVGALTLTAADDIDVSWSAAAPGTYPIANYRIQRSLSATGGFATVATQPGLSLDDTGVSPSTTYYYQVAAVDSMGNPGAYSPISSAITSASAGGGGGAPPVGFGVEIVGGKFVSTLDGTTPVIMVGSALISTEESQGYSGGSGGRIAGCAAVTSDQYTAASAFWASQLSSTARPYGTVNMIRVPLNSALWMGFTGRDPFGNLGGNYYSAGTDSAGNALYSGGPGGGPGTGQGSEVSGDPTAYRNYIKKEVAAILAAGLYVMLDLHWGTPTLTSTGQYVLPPGQTAMPGPGDVLFWEDIANTFGSQNSSTGSSGVLFELFNEPYGSNIFGNQVGTEAAYLGSQALTQFAFPTSTTSPGGTNGGYGIVDNFSGSGSPAPILGGGQTCYACGFQQVINAIRATGATNVVVVGCQGYTGEVETWSQNGGPMVVTDSIGQMAVAFHGYGYSKGIGNFNTLQAAGLPTICTEMGGLSNIPSSYNYFRSQGWAYTFWSWNNFGSSSNAYTSSMSVDAPWDNNGQVAPNGSN